MGASTSILPEMNSPKYAMRSSRSSARTSFAKNLNEDAARGIRRCNSETKYGEPVIYSNNMDIFHRIYELQDMLKESAFGSIHLACLKNNRQEEMFAVRFINVDIKTFTAYSAKQGTLPFHHLFAHVVPSSPRSERLLFSLRREVAKRAQYTTSELLPIRGLFHDVQPKCLRLAIVTEYAELGDLKSYYVTRKREGMPLTESEIAYLARVILRSLGLIHNSGLVHRAIRLDNILLHEDDCSIESLLPEESLCEEATNKTISGSLDPVLFLNKSATSSSSSISHNDLPGIRLGGFNLPPEIEAETHALMSNILYESPEMVTERFKATGITSIPCELDTLEELAENNKFAACIPSYSAKADVWRVGVVICELLLGANPFKGKTLADICSKILRSEIPGLASPKPKMKNGKPVEAKQASFRNLLNGIELSADCRDFVTKLLAADPDKRLSSAEALAHPFIAKRVVDTVLSL